MFWQVRNIWRRLEDTATPCLLYTAVWREIAPIIEGIPLVAHNSMFDEGCLKAVFRLYEMDYPGYSFYCTYRLSRKLFKGMEKYKLHTVSSFCGYDMKNHHHALADAEAAAVIMQSILQDVYKRQAPNFYSRRNTAIHGLSREDTEEALAFPTVWREIAPMIEGIPLVAHNSICLLYTSRCV